MPSGALIPATFSEYETHPLPMYAGLARCVCVCVSVYVCMYMSVYVSVYQHYDNIRFLEVFDRGPSALK